MEKQVGIRIKVASEGLDNVQTLSKQLSAAGVDTQALDAKAAELAATLRKLDDQQQLIDTFKRQKAAVADAGAALQDAKTQAGDLGRALTAVEQPTIAQQKAFAAARQAAREADAAYQSQRLELQQLRGQMVAAGVSTEDLASAQVRVRTVAAETGTRLKALEGEYRSLAAGAGAAATQQVEAAQRTKDVLADVSRQLSSVANAAQALIGGQLLGGLLGDLSKTADAYSNLAGKVRLAAGEGKGFDDAFNSVIEIATRTNSKLEDTGVLFTKITEAGKTLGITQEAALNLTQTINQAVQLSGASAEASAAAVQQLIQGLQSGVLRGDEFNSVMEQAPRLAKALADGLGITTGELRKLAETGTLTSQTVIGALQGQAAAVQTEFDKLPATVGRALTNLETQWIQYVGQVDQANGISKTAAGAIEFLAKNLDTLGTVLAEAGKGFAAYTALRVATYFLEQAQAVRTVAVAVDAETSAMRVSTVVTTGNTAATTNNTAAKQANAAAWGEVAAKLAASAAATTADTAASTAGAAAKLQLASAAGQAATAIGAAGAEAATAGSRLTAFRAGLATVAGGVGLVGASVAGLSLAWDAVKAAGSFIGESIAKLQGYKNATADLTREVELEVQARKRAAQETAAYAQQAAIAAEKSLGLSDAGRKVIGDFEELRKKGESAADAVKKLVKDLDFVTPKGINDAVTALDVLRTRSQITGAEIRATLAEALSGKDLGVFEVQARSTFDTSEQGARRLKSVLDSIADESLKRAGTSAEELRTGFSAAANRAINDTDALTRTLVSMGVKGDEAARLVGESIDKALSAAKSVKEVQAIGGAVERFRDTGLGSFQAVEGMMTKVRDRAVELKQKIEDVTPGIQGLGDAARKAGLDQAQLTGGLTRDGEKAIRVVKDLVDQVISTGTSAERSSPALAAMFKQFLSAARTKEEVAAINVEIQRAIVNNKLFGADAKETLDQSRLASQRFATAIRQAQADATELGIVLKEKIGLSAEEGVKRGLEAYERLKTSGKASAEELQQGFLNVGSAAIKAAKGVVPEWVKVEAQFRNVTIATDEAGKAVLKAVAIVDASILRLAGGFDTTSRIKKEADALASSPSLSGRTAASDFNLRQKEGTIGSVYTPPPDNSGDYEWVATPSKPGGEWQLSAAGSARRDAARAADQATIRTAYERAGIALPGGNAGLPTMGFPKAVLDQLIFNNGQVSLRDGTATAAPAVQAAPSPIAATPTDATPSSALQPVNITIGNLRAQMLSPSVGDTETIKTILRLLSNGASGTP